VCVCVCVCACVWVCRNMLLYVKILYLIRFWYCECLPGCAALVLCLCPFSLEAVWLFVDFEQTAFFVACFMLQSRMQCVCVLLWLTVSSDASDWHFYHAQLQYFLDKTPIVQYVTFYRYCRSILITNYPPGYMSIEGTNCYVTHSHLCNS